MGRDPVLLKQFREHAHHGLAVFQHVGDPGRGARVVLQHIEFVLADANEVGAYNMGIDTPWRGEADHLRQEGLVLYDEVGGYAAGPNDLLTMIDVVQEGVERAHALVDARPTGAAIRRPK